MKFVKSALIALAMTVSSLSWAADDVVVIYDASGSMWGQIDGVSKIEIAREVMADLINEWDDDTNLGLVAYGHRRQGDCSDIETLVEPGPLDKASFIKTVNAINPVGKTPIGASLQHAADLLSYRDSQATIILISDGLETCHADPCAVSEQLAKQGVKLTTHVVGFDLETEVHANLSCIADNTGGIFVPANNAAELHDALAQVQSAMDQEAAPEPEPEAPALPEVEITAPEQVTTGAPFSISWSDVIASDDYYTIVPVGTEEGKTASRNLVGDKGKGSLKAPAEPGLYEVRYVLREGMKTLASAPVEVVAADAPLDDGAGLSVPKTAAPGETITITWSGGSDSADQRISLARKDQPDFSWISVQSVGEEKTMDLTMPDETGTYEIRFLDIAGRQLLGRSIVEVR